MKPRCLILLILTLLVGSSTSHASVLPLSTAELIGASDAVFRGTVVGMSCFKDEAGLIYTRTSLRVDEPLKGKFPAILQVVHRGGQVGGEGEYSGLSPQFRFGGEYLLFVARGRGGRLGCTQGSSSAVPLRRTGGKSMTDGEFDAASGELLEKVHTLTQHGKIPGSDVTDQVGEARSEALTGMADGIASRFLQPDRGEPIPYLVDADSLPAGISLAQATNAVAQALSAWTAVTSLKFKFEGFQSFGMASPDVTNTDEKLRIQLHDNFNYITEINVLGVGGRGSSYNPIPGVGWDIGGNVAGNEFEKTSHGYLVLEATNTFLQNLTNLAEVLCHEIGHTLNLAHSSENPSEPNPVLKQAIMYFQAHGSGRGATLGAYDPPIIRQIYPSNTPPFMFNRMLDVITAPTAPSVAGINEVELRGYDLQATSLTFATANSSANYGSFSVPGSKVRYTPSAHFGDSTRGDPAGGGFYDRICARCSDGTNASPYIRIRVLSMRGDSDQPSDGLPNYWMTYYFGHTAPQAGDKSRATDDADGDSLSNLQEFITGTNPTNAASAQRITSFNGSALQFQAKAYELYEVLGSTNLSTWSRVGNPVWPTDAPIEIRTSLPDTTITATVSNLPTTGTRMFYRIQKVP